jgi:serine/threonine protein kinase
VAAITPAGMWQQQVITDIFSSHVPTSKPRFPVSTPHDSSPHDSSPHDFSLVIACGPEDSTLLAPVGYPERRSHLAMAETETHVSSVYEGESVRSYGEATSRSNHTGAEDGAIDAGAAGEPPRRRWRYHNLDSALLEFLAFLAECSVPVVSIQDLTFGDASLGGGQTMKVLAGKFKGQDVAIKLFKQHAFKPGYTTREPTAMEDEAATFAKSLKDLTFEIRIMRHPQLISHPNIVRLHAVAFQDGLQVPRATSSSPTDETATDQTPRARAMRQEVWFPVLVLEPAAKSYPDLAQFFKAHAHTEGDVSQEVVSSLICDIAMGLSSLHKLGITHGDVKDDNILLFNNSEDTEGSAVVAKVADFGAAGIDAAREATRAQSRYWAAPEALERPSGWEGLRLTPEADVYSFGILAATIALRGRKVFDGVEAYTVKMNDEAAEHITTQLASFEASGESSFLKSIEKVVNRTVLVDRRKRLGDLSLVAELLGKRRLV